MAKIEKECADRRPGLRCDVVTLYQGGQYDLYKYRRYQDVRLVFAPEIAIAFFGGDPDNFKFPRYDLDVSFVRIYEDGKPAAAAALPRGRKNGAKEGELTFVSGNPGRTSRRLNTSRSSSTSATSPARAAHVCWPSSAACSTEFRKRGAEQKRISKRRMLFGVENASRRSRAA